MQEYINTSLDNRTMPFFTEKKYGSTKSLKFSLYFFLNDWDFTAGVMKKGHEISESWMRREDS